jgi:hypothetical protein
MAGEGAIKAAAQSLLRLRAYAALLAAALIFLPAFCHGLFMASATVSAVQPAGSPCHNAPAPEAPSSEHRCCGVNHLAGAALTSAQKTPQPSLVLAAIAGQHCGPIAPFGRFTAPSIEQSPPLPLRI